MKAQHIKKSNVLILILFTFLSSSCHLLYLPNEINAPMLTDKGDFSGNISTGLSNFNLQVAFSPAQHIGLMANYAGGKNSVENSTNMNSYNFGEIGLGYYIPISNYILFDVYGGYGLGEAYTYDDSFDAQTNVNGKYSRIFLQPSVTISAKNILDANFALRPVLISMEKTTNYSTTTKSTSLFFEPVITLKYGWKYIKIINQIGLSIPTTDVNFGYNPLILSIGVNFQLKSGWKD